MDFIGVKQTDNSVWFLRAYDVLENAKKMFQEASPGPADYDVADVWAVYQLPDDYSGKPIKLELP